MEVLFNNHFTWANFLILATILWILYLGIGFIESLLDKINILGNMQPKIKNILRHTLLLMEPAAVVILSCVFVLISPITHGLILMILLVSGFNIIKNYLNGRILQFDHSIAIGNSISTPKTKGIISEIGRLGLKLRHNKGLQFVNYSNLMADGYSLLAGEEIGGYYHLKIIPKNTEEKLNHLTLLMDLLVTVPYLDWNHKPELHLMDENPNELNAKVLVKEESHLYDLLELIKDWGYQSKVLKN